MIVNLKEKIEELIQREHIAKRSGIVKKADEVLGPSTKLKELLLLMAKEIDNLKYELQVLSERMAKLDYVDHEEENE